ncbi:unnamed protein product [Cuscuta epithymum]|uniref:Secreted protein n=1 Tax=Cuscuta epithymum TaxID=186058 RepID=A0AAV0C366_9ASTE|nr:unnamed protein product [Cuscuta epithymum]
MVRVWLIFWCALGMIQGGHAMDCPLLLRLWIESLIPMTPTAFVFEVAVLDASLDAVVVRMDEGWVVEIALCFDGFRIGWAAFEETQSRQGSSSQNLGVLGCQLHQECRSYWLSCRNREE